MLFSHTLYSTPKLILSYEYNYAITICLYQNDAIVDIKNANSYEAAYRIDISLIEDDKSAADRERSNCTLSMGERTQMYMLIYEVHTN